jgi:hypothetical protein
MVLWTTYTRACALLANVRACGGPQWGRLGGADVVDDAVVPAADPPHDASTISSVTLPHQTLTARRIGDIR